MNEWMLSAACHLPLNIYQIHLQLNKQVEQGHLIETILLRRTVSVTTIVRDVDMAGLRQLLCAQQYLIWFLMIDLQLE